MKNLRIDWDDILPVVSCLGVVATAVVSSKAGTKASKLLEEQNYIHHPNIAKDIYEESKIVWKEYLITAAVVSVTIVSIVLTKKVTKRELAALGLLGTASSKLLRDYKRAIKEVVPEKYEAVVRRVTSYREHNVQVACPPPITLYGIGETIIDEPYPGEDETLFYDELFDVWFRTSLATVRTAQYHINRNFHLRGEATLQEFYEFIGINPPSDRFDELGWGEDFKEGGINWIDIATVLSDNIHGEKFFIIEYTFEPEALIPFDY